MLHEIEIILYYVVRQVSLTWLGALGYGRRLTLALMA